MCDKVANANECVYGMILHSKSVVTKFDYFYKMVIFFC